jgi:hypothetical protein
VWFNLFSAVAAKHNIRAHGHRFDTRQGMCQLKNPNKMRRARPPFAQLFLTPVCRAQNLRTSAPGRLSDPNQFAGSASSALGLDFILTK